MILTSIIIFLIGFGAVAIAIVVPANHISVVAGLMQAINVFLTKFHLGWLVHVIAIMIAIADQTANLFKDSFQRLRPCYNESLISFVRLVNESCGGKYGFFSAHASNSFSLAVFFGLLFKNKFRFIIYMTLFYASLISFSRIYLGVHFPLDIFFGGVYGIITGFFIFRIYENRLNFFKFLNKS